jgi:lysophospholipase L1-like esterase
LQATSFVRMRRSPLLLALAALLCACVAAPAAAAPKRQYYVSLGDSYAAGFQPTGVGRGHYTRWGFAYQVPTKAAHRGYRLKLVNFGCGGATTSSLLHARGCPPQSTGVDGQRYPHRTQIAAADRFLRRHRHSTALVSVSIGGNDVTACAKDPNPIPCVTAATARIKRNVARAAKRLRKAAGPKVRIVGTTYPDVILGLYPGGTPSEQSLATLSVAAFKGLINPTLKAAYAKGNARFVDVTEASGAYIPFDRQKRLLPYGYVPVAVARVCELSYYCAYRDIHLRTDGYRLIARLVADELPRRG